MKARISLAAALVVLAAACLAQVRTSAQEDLTLLDQRTNTHRSGPIVLDVGQLTSSVSPATLPGEGRATNNSFGQPFDWTYHLTLSAQSGEGRAWAAGYRTNSAEADMAWTNRVTRAAESGNTEVQLNLAIWLHDGTHGFATNLVQAYKWAAVAAAQGDATARRLVKEWEASMSPEDVAAGKAAAAAFTPRDKKAKNSSCHIPRKE